MIAFDFAPQPGHTPRAVLDPATGCVTLGLDCRTQVWDGQAWPVPARVSIALVPGVLGEAFGPYLRELIATLQMAEAAWMIREHEAGAA